MSFSLKEHFHIPPETDLIKWMKGIYADLEPVKLTHGSHIELWLWSFCFLNSDVRNSGKFRQWLRNQTENEPERTYAIMFKCATEYREFFNNYYDAYKTLVIGRKYLYFE